MGGEVVGVGVAHHRLWLQIVQPEEVVDDAAKGLEGLGGLQVADVLADEDLGVGRDGYRVLEMRAHRQQGREGAPDLDRKGGVAARASQDQFASQEHPGDRVVHVPSNGPVVDQEEVGDSPETSQRHRARRCRSAHRRGFRSWRRPACPVPVREHDGAGCRAA